MLRWLMEEGCPVGDYGAAREAAAQRKHSVRPEVLQLLEGHRLAQQQQQAAAEAAGAGNGGGSGTSSGKGVAAGAAVP
ncbi:hypothetical protein GPECTOR_22g961 [Gonium pectorale]|uniref:Uncharacterized protein n=1 Tax=Gonium pectorale TaxID=33097 RepID=A0A150GHS9_GONPE|nr:hypothetical protein GPECTOR_22g961 [Gonium pectorale]|eukprot:KXZ49367.1 hypothetical protein GPECTOR_22g961 [Gonium pectorale]